MDQTNLSKVRDVLQNHRAMLDEFEAFLNEGEAKGRELVVAVKGIVLSAAFLNELISQPAPGNGSAAPEAEVEAVTDQSEN